MNWKSAAKNIVWRTAPSVFRQLSRPARQEFSIGIMSGPSPFDLGFPNGVSNPVLTRRDVTDIPAAVVADPFMLRSADRWYMFFEVVNQISARGEIGLAVSDDSITWEYQRIVLREPFHLSYPYVFEWAGEYYMMPEGARGGGAALYKATAFPETWTRLGMVLAGDRFADSTIFRYDDKWWLFTDAGDDSKNPILRLYCAEHPMGPWEEHPSSPVKASDPHRTRPAGRIIVMEDVPIRFAQDVSPIYGRQVYAFRITQLSTTAYEERPVGTGAVLAPGVEGWNLDGMHHVDAHELSDRCWIACVDGFRFRGTDVR